MKKQLILGYFKESFKSRPYMLKIIVQTHRSSEFWQGTGYLTPDPDLGFNWGRNPGVIEPKYLCVRNEEEHDWDTFHCSEEFFESLCVGVLKYNQRFTNNNLSVDDVMIGFSTRRQLLLVREF